MHSGKAPSGLYQEVEHSLDHLTFKEKKADLSNVLAFYERTIKDSAEISGPFLATTYNNLACLYFLGREVRNDYQKALEYFTIAADKNLPEAMNNLGLMYLKGLGVEQNTKKALELFNQASNYCAAAKYHLGYCYDRGEGVTKDCVRAKQYYDCSSDRSGPVIIPSIAGSYFNLSIIYAYGLGVKSDPHQNSIYFNLGIKTSTQHIRRAIISINVPNEKYYVSPCSLYTTDQRLYLYGMSARSHVIRYENFINTSNLNKACFTNDTSAIESHYRIVNKAPTAPSENGDTPLILAILGCNENAVKFLLERGEDPNIGYYLLQDKTILSCMQLAIMLEHNGIRKLLQEAKAEFYPKSFCKMEISKAEMLFLQLHLSLRMQHEEMVKLLLEEGVGVNSTIYNTKVTPIMMATVSGSPRIVQLLLDAGADTNHYDMHDESALAHAAKAEDPDIIKVLLNAKITDDRTYDFFDDSYHSPFGIAIATGKEHLVKIFLQHSYYAEHPFTNVYYKPIGIKNVRNKSNSDDLETCDDETFEDEDTVISEDDKDNGPVRIFSQISSLHYAAELCHENIIKMLIEAFVVLNKSTEFSSKTQNEAQASQTKTRHEAQTKLFQYSTDSVGKTAFMVASEKGLYTSLQRMIKLPFDHHKPCALGKTALHYAVLGKSAERFETVFFLLKHGFSCNSKDERGLTSLAYAARLMQKNEEMGIPEKANSQNSKQGLESSYESLQTRCVLSLLLFYKLNEHLKVILEKNSIMLSQESAVKELNELSNLFVALKPKFSANDTMKIDVNQFPFSVIPKDYRKRMLGYLNIKENILECIVLKYITAKIISGKINLEKNNQKQVESSSLSDPKELLILTTDPKEFMKLIWECSSEKLKYDKHINDRKYEADQKQFLEKMKKIEDDLFWLKEGFNRYCDVQLNISAKRIEASVRLETITSLAAEVSDNTLGANKLRRAEEVIVQISKIFEQLQAKQVSFSYASDKLSPQIAAALKDHNLKIAKRLLQRLQKLDIYCKKLGDNLKEYLQDLQLIKEDLEGIISHEKHLRSIHEERLREIRTRQNKNLAIVFQKFSEAEDNLQKLRYACKERLKTQNANGSKKQQSTDKQNKSQDMQKQLKAKQKQDSFQEKKQRADIKQEADIKAARDLESRKMQAKNADNSRRIAHLPQGYGLLPDSMLVSFKRFTEDQSKNQADDQFKVQHKADSKAESKAEFKNQSQNQSVSSGFALDAALTQSRQRPQTKFNRTPQKLQLSSYIEPKRKASQELTLLLELIKEIAFAPQEKTISYCRMEHAAIFGVISRTMECYKNINAQALGVQSRKKNIFADYARIFRDAAFHNHDDKLFKKQKADRKKNAELQHSFLNMACNLLSFLNNPKWQKQSITEEELLKAFPADKAGNKNKDLFLKIISLPAPKKPSGSTCKEQIFLGWHDYNEFMKFKNASDKIRQAAMGFCTARIGTFAAELVKRPKDEDGAFRRIFNNLRREHKIPLGRFIQDGINFRHVLKSIAEIVGPSLKQTTKDIKLLKEENIEQQEKEPIVLLEEAAEEAVGVMNREAELMEEGADVMEEAAEVMEEAAEVIEEVPEVMEEAPEDTDLRLGSRKACRV